ncbi:tetratricopeptide repeat protein [Eleftheria terrae]|uniref:tetratricopeptide repeat protein n=1 Tax=Eleftheria terrae TaxID=1597781 RepID=UPI00263BB449|nr:tetratricopeptide repeat protein [Eleftheria terrae]WKB51399.1 tetratricopeptide repeat protein [Eleftheria terrae]
MQDPRGNPVSTRSPEALRHAEQALWRMVSFYGNPLPDLDAAAAADPGWLLPPVMRAGFLLTLTERAWQAEASAALAGADRLLAGAHPREQALLAGVRLGWQGGWEAACDCWGEVLAAHPRDLLALQWAHLFDFHRGDPARLLGRVQQVLPAWAADDPLRPYVGGMLAFGLEEMHRDAEAEAVGREALQAEVRVPWAVHAVAHVMEMQGRCDEGSAWLAGHEPHWSQDNGFAVHLWWHHALFDLERLDTGAALQRYDQRLSGDAVQIALQRLDAAALLWRLSLLGVDCGARWQALAAGWDCSDAAAGWSPFNDLHLMVTLLGCGDIGRAERWWQQVRTATSALHEREGPARGQAAATGLDLMQGLLQQARGEWGAAVRSLQAARAEAARIGGSHAQRDLIDQTLLAAAAADGQRELGRALLAARGPGKQHTPLTAHWAGRLG